MIEPTYRYTRGQGWTPTVCETLDFEHKGKKWRLEARKPELGERFVYCFERNDTYSTEDARPKLAAWVTNYFGTRDPLFAEVVTSFTTITERMVCATLTPLFEINIDTILHPNYTKGRNDFWYIINENNDDLASGWYDAGALEDASPQGDQPLVPGDYRIDTWDGTVWTHGNVYPNTQVLTHITPAISRLVRVG